MKHIRALAVKLTMIEAISLAVLIPLAGLTAGEALMVGLVNTLLLYILGDMVVLPLLGNLVATIGDGGIAFLATWLAPAYAGVRMIAPLTALVLAVVVMIAEYYFFHVYVRRTVLPGPALGGKAE